MDFLDYEYTSDSFGSSRSSGKTTSKAKLLNRIYRQKNPREVTVPIDPVLAEKRFKEEQLKKQQLKEKKLERKTNSRIRSIKKNNKLNASPSSVSTSILLDHQDEMKCDDELEHLGMVYYEKAWKFDSWFWGYSFFEEPQRFDDYDQRLDDYYLWW